MSDKIRQMENEIEKQEEVISNLEGLKYKLEERLKTWKIMKYDVNICPPDSHEWYVGDRDIDEVRVITHQKCDVCGIESECLYTYTSITYTDKWADFREEGEEE